LNIEDKATLLSYNWLQRKANAMENSDRHQSGFLESQRKSWGKSLQEKIDTIHEQVIRGDTRSVRQLLDKKGWANARDHYGHSPLHKSVMANQEEIMRFILESYPDHVEDRDNVKLLNIFMTFFIRRKKVF